MFTPRLTELLQRMKQKYNDPCSGSQLSTERWMLNLAKTCVHSFFLSFLCHFFLLSSTGKWWHSTGHFSQVSPCYKPPSCLVYVCPCIPETCPMVWVSNTSIQFIFPVHACVCMGMFISWIPFPVWWHAPGPFDIKVFHSEETLFTDCNWSHA